MGKLALGCREVAFREMSLRAVVGTTTRGCGWTSRGGGLDDLRPVRREVDAGERRRGLRLLSMTDAEGRARTILMDVGWDVEYMDGVFRREGSTGS